MPKGYFYGIVDFQAGRSRRHKLVVNRKANTIAILVFIQDRINIKLIVEVITIQEDSAFTYNMYNFAIKSIDLFILF